MSKIAKGKGIGNKYGRINMAKEKKLKLTIKHRKLLSKCSPPEKARIDNSKLRQNRNRYILFSMVKSDKRITNFNPSFQITLMAYFILRISPWDKSFSL
nr:hypothetical protein [Geosporobacter ferrireducens]